MKFIIQIHCSSIVINSELLIIVMDLQEAQRKSSQRAIPIRGY